ncbi:MAG: carbon-nitrogen hydrolase family protein [Candidatus Eutrophobiaceae bacterium]
MQRPYTACVAQMVSGTDLAENLSCAARLIAQAAESSQLILLPENFSLMAHQERDKIQWREDSSGPVHAFLAEQARRHGVYLVGGTVPLEVAGEERVLGSCPVYGPDGAMLGRYNKMHLFDAVVDAEVGETYRESRTMAPGKEICVLSTPLGKIGLSVCYDLRFPEIYREMVCQGAEILSVPSAFTSQTGQAHWESLLRARAIENQCYVLAANQGGVHENGRATWGHSMIIDPWGRVLASHKCGEGLASAAIDLEILHRIRRRMPCLKHRRLQ